MTMEKMIELVEKNLEKLLKMLEEDIKDSRFKVNDPVDVIFSVSLADFYMAHKIVYEMLKEAKTKEEKEKVLRYLIALEARKGSE